MRKMGYKNENDLRAGVEVHYLKSTYITGNRRNGFVKLYKNGKFSKIVPIKMVWSYRKKIPQPKMVSIADFARGKCGDGGLLIPKQFSDEIAKVMKNKKPIKGQPTILNISHTPDWIDTLAVYLRRTTNKKAVQIIIVEK